MSPHVLTFSKFILENRENDIHTTLDKEYEDQLSDFNYESEILSLIEKLERYWIKMEKDYLWNREYRYSLKFPHFALYAKLDYPDLEKISKIIKDDEADDDELLDIWYKWIMYQRAIFIDDLDYSWIKHVGWGGNSGGWILLTPNINYDDVVNDITELLELYISEKNEIKNNVSNWEYIMNNLEDLDYIQLSEIGLIEMPEEIINLKKSADIVIKITQESLQEAKNIEADLVEINNRLIKFKQNADSYFYSYLEEEY